MRTWPGSTRWPSSVPTDLAGLDAAIVACRRCPRLVEWCAEVARTKRAAYAGEEYWGGPVPGFGSAAPWLWIVGLAPGAHGANRTGRMFTGDRSGDWLFGALHRAGQAEQPTSVSRDDGQRLMGARITAAVHCAPPANKPSREEFAACQHWLDRELQIITPDLRVVLALGSLAWDAALRTLAGAGWDVPRPRPTFGHGASVQLMANDRAVTLVGSYHPSQQNTFTGRLTQPMLDDVLVLCRRSADLG